MEHSNRVEIDLSYGVYAREMMRMGMIDEKDLKPKGIDDEIMKESISSINGSFMSEERTKVSFDDVNNINETCEFHEIDFMQ